jgi:hypothetical protein
MSGDFLKKKLDKKRNRLSKLIIESNKIADNLKDDVKNTTHGQVGHKGYKRLKLPEVIERFKSVHGYTYDYSKVKYKNQITPITVICKEHGSFLITPQMHWKKVGCQKCKKSKKDDIEDWEDFEEVDLSKKRYVSDEGRENLSIAQKNRFNKEEERIKVGARTKEMWKDPEYRNKLKQHYSKPEWNSSKRDSKETFIEKGIKKHGDKYDYSKVVYVNSRTKVTIICPEYGEFSIRPANFLMGHGHPKSGYKRLGEKTSIRIKKYWKDPKNAEKIKKRILQLRDKQEDIIAQFKKVHGNTYDYSKVKYEVAHKKVIIICKKHGEFLQDTYSHKKGHGCPICGIEKSRRWKK